MNRLRSLLGFVGLAIFGCTGTSLANERSADRAALISALKTLTSTDKASPEFRAAGTLIQDLARHDVLVCVQLAHMLDEGTLGWHVLVDSWFREDGSVCGGQFGPVLEFLTLTGDEDLASRYLSTSRMRKWASAWRFAINQGSSESTATIARFAADQKLLEFADAIGERTARARSTEFLVSLPFERAREWSAVMADTLLKLIDEGASFSGDMAAGLKVCQERLHERYSEEILGGPGISDEERASLIGRIRAALARVKHTD